MPQAETTSQRKTKKQLRFLCYAYIVLLIIEGSLRKWALPNLSNPLLLIREPIVLLAYFIAWTRNCFPLNRYVISGLALMIICSITALLFGHGNPLVVAYGFKSNFWHIPFAFLIGQTFNYSDVIKMGRWWLWGTILMTALIVFQFYSPQSAWINRAPGGLEGGGFSGALGKFRPPGTFSFIVGVVWFYTFSSAFLIAGLTQHKAYSKILLALSSMAVFIAIPVSISRSLILAAGLTITIGICASAFQKNMLPRIFRIALLAGIGLLIASQFTVFDEAKEAFADRWERSTHEDKGGVQTMIVWRIAREFVEPFIELEDTPILGAGLGAGTQIGGQLLTGQKGFNLGESEWYRLIGESGILLGTLYIMWRLWIGFKLLYFALRALKSGHGLGIIFLSATLYNVFVGQLGQPTINGFTIIGIGFTIAAMRIPEKSIPTPSTNV